MIKSYDYLETSPDRSALQNSEKANQEYQLAQSIVASQPTYIPVHCNCPACGASEAKYFFSKWNVRYLRCTACESVFAPVNHQSRNRFKSDTQLSSFRLKKEYQDEATELRKALWMETLDWISFRTYRYLGKNKNLSISDVGNRYYGFRDLISSSPLCGQYRLFNSPLEGAVRVEDKPSPENMQDADLLLMLDYLQQSDCPTEKIRAAASHLKRDGLLFLSVRSGTGMDILTLGEHAQIYPYEHIFLPSIAGLKIALEKIGFKVLEWATPGQMDVGYIKSKKEFLNPAERFVYSFLRCADDTDLGEFQRLLQRVGLSSHARIVARKV